MKKANLAYMAGIIDGEGCIQIYKKTKRGNVLTLCVAVGMSSPLVPYTLQSQFGGTVAIRPVGQSCNNHPLWVWRVQAGIALMCLEAVLPYLIEKRKQAEVGICFQKNRNRPGQRATEKHKAVEETQRILLINYHKYRERLI